MRKGQTIAVRVISTIANLKGYVIAENVNVEDLTLDDLKMDSSSVIYATGMTAKQFGDVVGIPKRSVEQWRNGERELPPYLNKLMQYYLINEGYLKDYKVGEEKAVGKIKGKELDVIEGKITNLCGCETAENLSIEDFRLSDLNMEFKDILDRTGLNNRQFSDLCGMPLRTVENKKANNNQKALYINNLLLYYLINEGYIKDYKIEPKSEEQEW